MWTERKTAGDGCILIYNATSVKVARLIARKVGHAPPERFSHLWLCKGLPVEQPESPEFFCCRTSNLFALPVQAQQGRGVGRAVSLQRASSMMRPWQSTFLLHPCPCCLPGLRRACIQCPPCLLRAELLLQEGIPCNPWVCTLKP